MLIAVASDTHRSNFYINKVKDAIKNAEVLIHLGDNTNDCDALNKEFKGMVYGVSGNCDYFTKYPLEEIVEVLDKKILITHGHVYEVKFGLGALIKRAKELQVDMVLFGHTHEAIIIEEDNIIIMNPGSASMPRNGKNTIGFIEIEEDKPINTYFYELH